MPKDTLNTRVKRLETNMAELQDMAKILLAAQIRNEDEHRDMLKEQQQMREETDRRIRELVSAIGELIRRNGH